jgi:hypothetical protein
LLPAQVDIAQLDELETKLFSLNIDLFPFAQKNYNGMVFMKNKLHETGKWVWFPNQVQLLGMPFSKF